MHLRSVESRHSDLERVVNVRPIRLSGILGKPTYSVLIAMVLVLTATMGTEPRFCHATEPGSSTLTLEDAIHQALTRHASLRAAMKRHRAALEAERIARADLLPKLSASYQYFRLEDQPYGVFGFQRLPIGHKSQASWEVTVTQPLFTGFALVTKRKIAELEKDIQGLEEDQVRLDLIRDVKLAYYRILLARRRLDVAREEVDQLQAHLRDAENFYRQGMIPRNDVLKSQVALAQAIQDRVRASKDLEIARASLNVLLARHVDAPLKVWDEVRFAPLAVDPKVCQEQAILNRPELRRLRRGLVKAQEAVKLARSSYYPQVALVGRYERAGRDVAALENDFQNSETAAVGFTVEWPLFEWGKTKAEVRRVEFEREALEAKLQQIEDSVRLEVKAALDRVLVAQENVVTARKALEQAQENFRITRIQYRQQVTTNTEVLDARAYLSQAETNYYGALYGFFMAKAGLERAMGVEDLT